MFTNLIATLRSEIQGVVTTLLCAAVAASAAMVAILFVAVAIFIWMSNTYGALQACLAMAGFFIVVALIAGLILMTAQKSVRERALKRAAEEKKQKEEAAKNAPPAWLDPALIPTLLPFGIKAAQIALRHRGVLLALVSSAAVGWALLREKGETPADDAAEQPAE